MPIEIHEAIKKVGEYIFRVDDLLKKSCKEGTEKRRDLDTAIQNFVRITFSDGEEKLEDYRGSVHFYVGILGREESEEEKQEDYVSRLKKMKNHLVAYREELELRSVSRKKSAKLDKIAEETRIVRAEAERRSAVVDEKRWGAVIELLTILRAELKERGELSQQIIDLKKDVQDIKSMFVELFKAIKESQW